MAALCEPSELSSISGSGNQEARHYVLAISYARIPSRS